jgi:hypothetical protein
VRAAWILVVVASSSLAALGCGGGKDDAGGSTSEKPAGDQAASSPAIDSVIDAWKKGGLSPSAMAPAKAFGKTCQTGTVKDVEVVICEVDGDKKAAEKAGFDWVGETTGSSWVSGGVVIAAADRKKADKDGKTINQLMKLAPK